MNSSKKIEINQSSLLGLKAELLRKKNEVSSAKYSQQITPAKISTKKLVTKLDKSNEGVNERDKRDAEEFQEECDELKKSKKILEAKSKLYDKLVKNIEGIDPEINVSGFLVDFKQKNNEKNEESEKLTPEVESDVGEYSDDDDWVDFVDCLGRTKRCHKDDLQAMKEQDEKLKISLHGDNKVKENDNNLSGVHLPQLCSEDMKREIMRQKWEEQERNLLEKKNVHYQDVLFDEARTHGVGYYGFSTDEEERAKQQEELKKLRKETERQQAETQTAAQRKQKQMAERLKAARRRKRERLGLPPEEDDNEEEEKEKESEIEEPKPEPVEELRRDIRKPGPIRPWDIGKEKTRRILTQEEWIEKKRSERIDEFAPPTPQPKEKPKKRPFQKQQVFPEKSFSMEPVLIEDELEKKEEIEEKRGRGAEIPPPPTFEMYGQSSKPRRNFANMNQAEIDRSIEEGLNFLRRQVEEKQRKRREEEIDIM